MNILRTTHGSAYRANPDGSISHQCQPGARFRLFSPTPSGWSAVLGAAKADLDYAVRALDQAERDHAAVTNFLHEHDL